MDQRQASDPSSDAIGHLDQRARPSFAQTFEALFGAPPFPWQRRLYERLAAGGGWPRVLALPAAAGKTAALDLAVSHLAEAPTDTRRAAPSRIIFVSERRTFVDHAWIRARAIHTALARDAQGVLAPLRHRLMTLGSASSGLSIVHGRGVPGGRTALPTGPLILVDTGDGIRARLRAGDPALEGDCLWLLDEVPAGSPLRALVLDHARTSAPPCRVVDLSASPPDGLASEVFALDEADVADPVLGPRINTKKPVLLWREVTEPSFAAVAASAAGAYVVGGAKVVGVFANQLATARAVLRRLEGEVGDLAEVAMVSGHMRPLDRIEAERRLAPRLCPSLRRRSSDERPVVVVATQCFEAGPDADFDAVVTEAASLDVLRQRFGRLNRMGQLAAAPGAIVAHASSQADDPVYGAAARETSAWLASLPAVDFAPLRLPTPEPALHARCLGRNHDPSAVDGTPEVHVAWRRDLDDALLELAMRGGPEDAWAEKARHVVRSMVAALPPHPLELVAVSLAAVRAWLLGEREVLVTDLEGAPIGPAAGDPGRPRQRRVVRVRDGVAAVVYAADLEPGDIVIAPTAYGGLVDGHWDATGTATVPDRAEEAIAHAGSRVALRLQGGVLKAGGIQDVPLPSATVADELVVSAWLDRVEPRSGSWVAQVIARLKAARGPWTIQRVPAVSGADAFVVSALER